MKSPIFIVGGGHAGVEAALAISRLKQKCVIVTMDKMALGRMSCNPAIGGLAKSHLVHEIDALGGIMSVAADACGLQYKTLNMSKGRAVRSLRIQTDKKKYPKFIANIISKDKNISVLEGEVVSFKVYNSQVSSVSMSNGENYNCSSLIITSGTFLSGLIHIGNKSFRAGRFGEASSLGLTETLKNFGFSLGRLKTGTPPRVLKSSIDWSKTTPVSGDVSPTPFSLFRSSFDLSNNAPSHSVSTNSFVHEVLLENINQSPMYSGSIDAVGPRYCPSVEDKVVRFSDENSHSLFLEPEWKNSDQIYLGGFSTSMPESVQLKALRLISGLEKVELIRPGYAIEYDFIPTYQLKSSLESKNIRNLFFAGQINGTSGYEEAAAQGLIAGINAHLKSHNKKPFVLPVTSSYIAAMIDELVTNERQEPLRVTTSSSEFRLILRNDNAEERLTPIGYKLGLIKSERYNKVIFAMNQVEIEISNLNKHIVKPNKRNLAILESLGSSHINKPISMAQLLARSEIKYEHAIEFGYRSDFDLKHRLALEVRLKYSVFINKFFSAV